MLEVVGLAKRYGDVVALGELTLEIPAGEVVGLLGPNGSGKTTAMRIVMGVVRPDAGAVRWMGGALGHAERRRFGYLPEERGLYPSMRVLEQLTYLGRLSGMSSGRASASARSWLERLGLSDRATHKVSTLSLGNQQRVQLAAALVHGPEVLILDEPFSGLDPMGMDTMGSVLEEAAASGATVVFSSHQLDLVEDRCRSVAILNAGRLVAAGRVDYLRASGRKRLVVEVDSAEDPWLGPIEGVTISETEAGGRRARLLLEEGVDPQRVLEVARQRGPVTHFTFEQRRLSEVFREAVSS